MPPSGSTCPPKAAFDIGVSHLHHGTAHGVATATRYLPPATTSALPWLVLPAALAQEGWPSSLGVPPGIPWGGCQHPSAASLTATGTASLLTRVSAGAVAGREMLSTGGARGVLPAWCLPCREGRSCDGQGRGGSRAVSHGEGEGEQLPGSDNAAGAGSLGSCARVLPQQEPSATKPSSALPISHSGLTFQQLPLHAGFTSSL